MTSRRSPENGTSVNRRQFLKALGASALAIPAGLSWSRAFGQALPSAPRRVVFFITPHGTVQSAWKMANPGPLLGQTFSPILAPLQPYASKLQIVEGLSRSHAMSFENQNDSNSAVDLNAHHFGRPELLTGSDTICISVGGNTVGGAPSIDQVIGAATTGPGRFSSRVYGPPGPQAFSWTAARQATASVVNAYDAYLDVASAATPTGPARDEAPLTGTRNERLRAGRARALELAAAEHGRISQRLGSADKQKLERHRDLLRDLESFFAPGAVTTAPGVPTDPTDPTSTPSPSTNNQPYTPAECNPSWSAVGHEMDRFARVITLALSCDLTRVITYTPTELNGSEFGYTGANVHNELAHESVIGAPSWNQRAVDGMIAYNNFYATHFAYLLAQLDSVQEGNGTLLDNTAVVWLTEHANGGHRFFDVPVVIAGGCGGRLKTNQYVRYAQSDRIEGGWGFQANVGPAQNRLYVTLMQAMGMSNTSFGATSVPKTTGGTQSLTGVLPELMV